MKFLKGLFYFIVLLFCLFFLLVVLCGLKPELSENIANFIYSKQSQSTSTTEEPSTVLAEPTTLESDTATLSDNVTSKTLDAIASNYVAPDQSKLTIPSNVSSKTGYQQVQEKGSQVEDSLAEQVQSQLTTGSVGDGLTFDSRFYPYYAMLSDVQKHLYRQIYANANDCFPVFAPVEKITPDSLKDVFSAVYNDHPELFWLDTAYTYKYMANGNCIEIGLVFNRTAQDLTAEKATFEEKADLILAKAKTMNNPYEQEKFVHDLLLAQTSYQTGAEMNQSAYSALVNGKTVCAGYARALQYLLQQLSIPCYYCTGYAGESHAWNIVELDGEYYNVDATWDDTGAGTYDYFNKTDADYANTHIRQDLSVYLPACNGESFRNIEPEKESLEAESPTKRSLSDVGMTEDQILTTLTDYYNDCSKQITEKGMGTYTFYNVLSGIDLAKECDESYTTEAYRSGYMETAGSKIGASYVEIFYQAEELQEGYVLMHHQIWFW